MSERTEFVVLKRMGEKGKLSFEDIKKIIDRSVNKTHAFINNMIKKELIEELTPYTYVKKKTITTLTCKCFSLPGGWRVINNPGGK